MGKILKFKLDLVVVRFKIKGAFNVSSLLTVLSVLLVGTKIFQHWLGNYEQLSILLGLFIYVFFCKYIFVSDFDMKWKQMITYFNAFKEQDVKKYYLYKNLITFLAILVFVLFPTRLEDVDLFLLYIIGINILLFIQILSKNLLSINKYSTFNLIVRILLCGCLILYLKNYQLINIKLEMSWYSIIICLILNAVLILEEFKFLKEPNQTRGMVVFVNWSKKIPLFRNNSDFIFAVRTNLLIEPLLIIICGNIVIHRISGDLSGDFFTLIISYLCSFLTVYRMLIKNEEKKTIYFYQGKSAKQIKTAKIKNAIYISVPLFIITLLPLLFLLPIYFVIAGYICSLIIFILASISVKIEAEKNFNYRLLLSDKNVLQLIIVQIVLGFIVSYTIAPKFISYIGRIL
ncbi:MAG: hypothetical protein E7B11_15165 [Clostridiales bacterium]|nr:hypothetical protein [Clostridiales bacterium]MDU3241902.1 hypothetical protein [Clostridiales bacterium]